MILLVYRKFGPIIRTFPPAPLKSYLLPENPYSRPGTLLERVNGVVIHYVGNPNTSAQANHGYFASLAETGDTYAVKKLQTPAAGACSAEFQSDFHPPPGCAPACARSPAWCARLLVFDRFSYYNRYMPNK